MLTLYRYNSQQEKSLLIPGSRGAFPRKGLQVCAPLTLWGAAVGVCWGREGELDLYGTDALVCPAECKSSCLPERQERTFVVQMKRFPMHGVQMKSRKSKIPLKCWCPLTVNCSTNCWTRFEHSVLSCAKSVLTKGVAAFHWESVEKLIQRPCLTYQGKLILLLQLTWWSI